jgi:hypothetical protein
VCGRSAVKSANVIATELHLNNFGPMFGGLKR